MTFSKKKLAELHSRIDFIAEVRRLNGGAPVSVWRSKPVIPVSMWESMLSRDFRQALGYFPNGYTDRYLQQIFSAMLSKEYNDIELDVWKEGYLAFLEHTANPVRGRELCAGCLLKSPEDLYGLRKIFTDALVVPASRTEIANAPSSTGGKGLGDRDYTTASNNQQEATADNLYPCRVLNRFECPFKRTNPPINDEGIIELGKNLDTIEKALSFASELTTEEDYMRYEVDFDHDRVKSGPEMPTAGTIEDLPNPKAVTVTHISDIYNVLTTPEILDKVLYQYLSNENPQLNLKHNRDKLVKLVMTFKDKFKMQDLLDGCGRAEEDSEEDIKRMQSRVHRLVTC